MAERRSDPRRRSQPPRTSGGNVSSAAIARARLKKKRERERRRKIRLAAALITLAAVAGVIAIIVFGGFDQVNKYDENKVYPNKHAPSYGNGIFRQNARYGWVYTRRIGHPNRF